VLAPAQKVLLCSSLVAASLPPEESQRWGAAAAAEGPPAAPGWPSPLPRFPSSWFGANMRSFEFAEPAELAQLKRYTQVLASWPELVLASGFSNGTAIAVEDATRMKALLGPQTSVFTYQSMWVAAGFCTPRRPDHALLCRAR